MVLFIISFFIVEEDIIVDTKGVFKKDIYLDIDVKMVAHKDILVEKNRIIVTANIENIYIFEVVILIEVTKVSIRDLKEDLSREVV